MFGIFFLTDVSSPVQCSIQFMRVLLLPLLSVLFLNNCSKRQDEIKHEKVGFDSIKINDVLLGDKDEQEVNKIISGASRDFVEIYDAADFMVFGYVGNPTETRPRLFSFYAKEQMFYEGDWLDARTEALKGNKVECWKISDGDNEPLQQLRLGLIGQPRAGGTPIPTK